MGGADRGALRHCRGRASVTVALTVAASLIWQDPAAAQDYIGSEELGRVEDADTAEAGFRAGQVRVVPIPFQNPTVGAGLALVAGYIFRADPASDTSYVGVGGFKSENGSTGLAFALSTSFAENTWKLDAMAGRVDLRYRLRVEERNFDIAQEFPIYQIGVQRAVQPDTFLGLRLRYMETDVALDGGGALPGAILQDRSSSIGQLELTVDASNLDDSDYPTRGYRISGAIGTGRVIDPVERSFDKSYLNASGFLPLGGGVLAGEFSLCGASSSTPFYLRCSLGGTDNLRGFSPTEYLGTSLISAQGEYRGRFSNRWGYTLFAGAGNVGDSLGGGLPDIVYAGGAGLRLRISDEFKLDVSLDAAVNNFEETEVYLYVGQRF